MNVERKEEDDSVFISQKGYLEKVLQRYEMMDAKIVLTRLASHFKLSQTQKSVSEKEKHT